MRIVGLHHAQICVPNGAEAHARDFYCGLLGLAEVDKPDALAGRGGLWLQVGDRQLHIGTEGDVDRMLTKAHLAYEVDDVEAWRTRLLEHGVATEDGVKIPGYVRFEFRDPFGNRVELIQRVPDPTG